MHIPIHTCSGGGGGFRVSLKWGQKPSAKIQGGGNSILEVGKANCWEGRGAKAPLGPPKMNPVHVYVHTLLCLTVLYNGIMYIVSTGVKSVTSVFIRVSLGGTFSLAFHSVLQRSGAVKRGILQTTPNMVCQTYTHVYTLASLPCRK